MDPPELLFHYTTTDGLLGIVEQKALWATDIDYLNDASELGAVRGLFVEALQVRADATRTSVGTPSSAQPPFDPIDETIRQTMPGWISEPRGGIAYVACFCEEPDLLSQWRGYASGGYAIGFESKALGAATVQRSPELQVEVAQVRYDPTAWRDEHRRELELLLDGFDPVRDIEELLGRVWPRYAFSWASVKDGSFQEEREWRLILGGHPSNGLLRDPPFSLRFRRGALGVTPYVCVGIDVAAIRQVWVGPGAHAHLRREAAYQLLRSEGNFEATVKLSAIPFRP